MRHGKVVISSVNNVGPGLKAAAKDLFSFESNVVRVGNALKSALSIGAITAFGTKVVQFGAESVRAFGEAERSMIQLRTALGGNEASFDRMNDFISELSRRTLASKDDIEDLVADLASLGKSDADIERVANAAVNLSNVTGQSLDEAFKQVNATFSGTAGKLEKLIPELGNLTKEQLAAGDAADVINRKFGDLSTQMSQGISQSVKNLSDSWGDFTEEIGALLAPALDTAFLKLTETLDKMGRAIRKFRGESSIEDQLADLAEQIQQRQAQLKILQAEAARLTARGVTGVAVQNLLDEINRTKGEIAQLENAVSALKRKAGATSPARTVTTPSGPGTSAAPTSPARTVTTPSGPGTSAAPTSPTPADPAAAIDKAAEAADGAAMAFQGWNFEATNVASAMTELPKVVGPLEQAWTGALDRISERTKTWTDFISDSIVTMVDAIGSGFEALGKALVNNENPWKAFAATAVEAIAAVLRQLGALLIAKAFASLPNIPMFVALSAASVAAFVAAGAASAWAAKIGGAVGGGSSEVPDSASPGSPQGAAAQYTGSQAITFNFYNQGNVVGSGGLEELAMLIDSIIKRNARYA